MVMYCIVVKNINKFRHFYGFDAYWALLLSISRNFATLSSVLEDPDISAHLSRVSSRFRLLVPPSGRTMPFLFLALRPGMGSLWCYVFFRGLSHLSSFLVLKQFFCRAGVGSASE